MRVQDYVLIGLIAMASLDASAHDSKPFIKNLKEARCMTEALYHEARGESTEGMIAVKKVIINRMRDKRWPGTICTVVYQPMQFSFANGNKLAIKDKAAWKRAARVANITHERDAIFYGATHYFNPYVVKPSWAQRLTHIKTIGNHAFYK